MRGRKLMRKWTLFCMVAFISIMLMGCGSDEADSDNENADESADTTETTDIEEVDTADGEDIEEETTEMEATDIDTEEETTSAELDIDPNGENTVTLQLEQNGVLSKIIYYAEGDKVIEQTTESTIPYASLGVTNKAEAEAALEEGVASYQGVEGVNHSIEYQDDQILEDVTVNYEEADPAQLAELTGAVFEGNVENGISLQRSIEMIQGQGFEIVEE